MRMRMRVRHLIYVIFWCIEEHGTPQMQQFIPRSQSEPSKCFPTSSPSLSQVGQEGISRHGVVGWRTKLFWQKPGRIASRFRKLSETSCFSEILLVFQTPCAKYRHPQTLNGLTCRYSTTNHNP